MLFYVNTIKEGGVLAGQFMSACMVYMKSKNITQLQLTIASMRLLVQQTRILVKLRNLSSAVRS